MNGRALTLFMFPYSLKAVLVTDDAASFYEVAQRFSSDIPLFGTSDLVKELIEELEQRIDVMLLDEHNNIVISSGEDGVQSLHIVLHPLLFLRAFVLAQTDASLEAAEKMRFRFPITVEYESHLLRLRPDTLIERFDALMPTVVLLVGGDRERHLSRLVRLADYLSLVKGDKASHSIVLFGSPLEKDEIFKRLSPLFSLRFVSRSEQDAEKKIRAELSKLLLEQVTRHIPFYFYLPSSAVPQFGWDVAKHAALLVAKTKNANTLILHFASSFVVCACAWKEKTEWRSDYMITEYRFSGSDVVSDELRLLIEERCFYPSALRTHGEELCAAGCKRVNRMLSSYFSKQCQTQDAHLLFASPKTLQKSTPLFSAVVYSGDAAREMSDDAARHVVSDLSMLDTHYTMYHDLSDRLSVFAVMDKDGSGQTQSALEGETPLPIDIHTEVLRPDTRHKASLRVLLSLHGDDVVDEDVQTLTAGHRYVFTVLPGQQAVVAAKGGTIAGKQRFSFDGGSTPFSIMIDLRNIDEQ